MHYTNMYFEIVIILGNDMKWKEDYTLLVNDVRVKRV
jgi:hypothetical protein